MLSLGRTCSNIFIRYSGRDVGFRQTAKETNAVWCPRLEWLCYKTTLLLEFMAREDQAIHPIICIQLQLLSPPNGLPSTTPAGSSQVIEKLDQNNDS